MPTEPPIPDGLPEQPDASFNPDRSRGTVGTDARRRHGDIARWMLAQSLAQSAPNAYLLKQVVGRGGFGEVWEAQQSSLGRTVAIKRLRDDLIEMNPPGSEGSLHLTQLFEQEAVTTALLDHPNIVPIYDLGRDGMGNPLLAMKLVRGTPWSDMLKDDFKALGIDEFLAKHVPILIDVAQAVAFAHARGIIHRDIKPAQVMVGDFGEVLLMDWGLAVVFQDGRLDELRNQGLPVDVPGLASASNPAGTVSFMAPEQTLDTARVLGPWTDIYLLSGCLYWLLTGSNPHPGSREVAYREARSGYVMPVAERAPGRANPEELVALAERGLANAKERRPASAKEFVEALRGFLSGRTRRKESERLAREAAAELDRAGGDYRTFNHVLALLEGAVREWPANPAAEPLRERALEAYAGAAADHGDLILARVQAERLGTDAARASLLARIDAAEAEKKQQRQQRRFLGRAAAGLGVALLAGAAGFAFVLHRKNAEESRLRTLAETRFADAERARRNATAARKGVEDMNRFMLEDFRERLAREDPEELVVAMAEQSMRHYASQLDADLSTGESQSVVGGLLSVADLYTELGRGASALEASRTAVAVARKAPDADPAAKEAMLRAALLAEVAGLEIVKPDEETAAKSAEVLAMARRLAEGRPGDADALQGLALALRTHASVLHTRGRISDGAALYKESLDTMDRLAALKPGDDRIIADRSRTLRRYVRSLETLGRLAEAEPLLRAVSAELEQLFARRSDDTSLAEEMLRARESLSESLAFAGQRDEALALLRSARATAEELIERHPTNVMLRRVLVDVLGSIGDELMQSGDAEAGIEASREQVETVRGLAARPGADPQTRMKYAAALSNLASNLEYSGFGDGMPPLEEALKVLEQGEEQFRDDQLWQTRLSNTLRMHGDFLRKRSRLEPAREAYEKGRRIVSRVLAIDPKNTALLRQQGRLSVGIGDIHMISGRIDEALRHLEEARATFERQLELDPANRLAQRELAQVFGQTATLLGDNGRREEAVGAGGEAARILRQLAASDPTDIFAPQVLTRILVDRSLYLLGLGRIDEAVADADEGLALVAPVRAAGRMDAWWYNQEAALVFARGRLAEERGDLAEAYVHFDRSRVLNEENVARNPAIPDARARLVRAETSLCQLLLENGATDGSAIGIAESVDESAARVQEMGFRAESMAVNRAVMAGVAARALEAAGDAAAAQEYSCRAIDAILPYWSTRTPDSVRIIYAESLHRLGRRDEAVAVANLLIASSSKSADLERLCRALGIAYPLSVEEAPEE